MKIKLNYVLFILRRKLLINMMRTFIFLCFTAAFSLTPNNLLSQNVKIKIKSDKILTVDEVFDLIMQQTDYKFIYQEGIFNDFPKVEVKKGIIKANDLLEKSLSIANFVVSVGTDNTVVVKKKTTNNSQQQYLIKGIVFDKSGQPLPGANILEKGTSNGTQTDFDGKFSIEVTSKDAVLVISYIGFATQEVVVGNQSEINIVLLENTSELNEVVIVGYGTSTKRKLASAVTKVETDEIELAPYTSTIEGLQGRSSGVFIQQSGGDYGSLPTVSIRGAGEPTYVIDGIIASKKEFALIPASDVENISFLKDASASAVYGFNSANGVVVVTTKKGKDQKLQFNVNSDLSIQRPTLIPDYMSPYEVSLEKNVAAARDNLEPIVDAATLEIMRNNSDPSRFPILNPFRESIKSAALQRRHNLTLNGTNNSTGIFMSLDVFNQEGVYKVNDNHGLDRYSFRTNISHSFENIGLTVNGNISLQQEFKESPPSGNFAVWSHVRNWGSRPIYNPFGNYTGLENPLAEADAAAGYFKEEETRVNSRLVLNWDIPGIDGLSAKIVGNYRFTHDFDKLFNANQRFSAQTYNFDNVPDNVGLASLSESTGRSNQYDLEGHLNYKQTFNDIHTLELTAVYTISESYGDVFSASRRDFVSSAVDQLIAGSDNGKDNSGKGTEFGRTGLVGRIKYDFDSKYIVDLSGRYDGYDGFAPEQRHKFFPSVGIAWNIDREDFAKPLMDKVGMSALKLRASIGEVGQANNRFSYLATYNLINQVYYVDGSYQTGFREGTLPPLAGTTTWFTKQIKNIALEFGFLNNRLYGSFDWFYNNTTGYLGSPEDIYTTTFGQTLPVINTDAAFRQGGFEMDLNYKFKIGDVSMNVGGNLSFYDELWKERNDENESILKNPYQRQTGVTSYYGVGYQDLGFYQSMDDILNSPRPLASTSTQAGDIKYLDFNGDGRIDVDDQTRIGNSEFAHLSYGIIIDMEYGGFKLNALFQGAGKRSLYLGNIWQDEINNKLYTIQANDWSEDNRNALFPRTSNFAGVNGGNNSKSSTFWLVDGSYFRLKSLSLSYDLKSKLKNTLSIFNRFDIILSGTNLFTISKLNDYYLDPETGSNNNYDYPIGKSYNLGFRLTL